jgi:hypothetical protein
MDDVRACGAYPGTMGREPGLLDRALPQAVPLECSTPVLGGAIPSLKVGT